MVRPGTKKVLEFNAEERRNFLSGFSKRKNERRKKAQNEIEEQLKKERLRIRKERREAINSRIEELTNIKLEHGIEPSCIDLSSNTVDLPNHSVTVVESELFDPFLNVYIGDNKDDESSDEEAVTSNPSPIGLHEGVGKKKLDINKSMAAIQRLKKNQRTLKTQGPKMRRQNKSTKKFMRKKKRKSGKSEKS